jgi:hypothetical protein
MAAMIVLFLIPLFIPSAVASHLNSTADITVYRAPPKFFNIGVMFAIAINDQPSPYLDYFGAM